MSRQPYIAARVSNISLSLIPPKISNQLKTISFLKIETEAFETLENSSENVSAKLLVIMSALLRGTRTRSSISISRNALV